MLLQAMSFLMPFNQASLKVCGSSLRSNVPTTCSQQLSLSWLQASELLASQSLFHSKMTSSQCWKGICPIFFNFNIFRTELLGGVSVLYGSIVLEQNSDNQHGGIKLSPAIERTTMLILRSINSAATLSIETMQRILGQELLQVRSGLHFMH